jgi:hypothetical protein
VRTTITKVCGVWRLAFGVWRLAFGVWRLSRFNCYFGLDNTSSVCGVCVACVWRVCGVCVACVWRVCGVCVSCVSFVAFVVFVVFVGCRTDISDHFLQRAIFSQRKIEIKWEKSKGKQENRSKELVNCTMHKTEEREKRKGEGEKKKRIQGTCQLAVQAPGLQFPWPMCRATEPHTPNCTFKESLPLRGESEKRGWKKHRNR